MLRVHGIHSDQFSPVETQDTEQTKKLQRNVSELVRRIDSVHQSAVKVRDVFSEEGLDLRVRLREYCFKLLHTDPERFGLKYIEILWRKAWHEPVSLARQFGGGAVLLDSHLLAGIGQFHNLLQGLSEQYGSMTGFKVEFMVHQEYGYSAGKQKKRTAEQWMVEIGARCLLWLGDLSRYRIDILSDKEKLRAEVLARKYYSQSTKLKPSLGLAYNQLAAVPGAENKGIDQLFFYLKCVTSKEKFEGGETNLKRMLEKTEMEANNLAVKSVHEVSSVYLAQLVSAVLGEKNEDDIILSCQQSLSSIHQATSAGSVPATWLLRTTACVILLIVKLGGNNTASVRVGLCQAWLLALTSHLAGLIISGLGKGLWGDGWTESSISLEDSSEAEDTPPPAEKKKRKKLTDLLRRKRVSHSGSSDESDISDDEEVEDESESDEFVSESDEDEIYFSDSDEDSDDSDVVVESIESELPDTCKVVEVCKELGYLPALTLCCMWLKVQPDVLSGMGDGGTQLWNKLARVFTLLNLNSNKYTKNLKISRLMTRNAGCALEEDFFLREIEIFGDQLKSTDWNTEPAKSGFGETVARMVRMEGWRDWLVGREECLIRWREGEGRAVLVKSSLPEKKCVMKHMAELWLKEEVSNLEKNNPEVCTIIIDAHALTTDLNMVKRVAGYKKFTVIVPQIVIKELDFIKKQVREARLAIRWLEREMSRGHAGLQPQEKDEKAKISIPAPGRKDAGWARYSVLECVAFFAASQDVVLLSGDPEILEHRDTQTLQVLSNLGVRVENVEDFMQRFLGLRDVVRERKRSGEGIRHRSGDGSKQGKAWRRHGRDRRGDRKDVTG